MKNCIQLFNDGMCSNLELKQSVKNDTYFWGCILFPDCDKTKNIHFNPKQLTDFEKKIYHVFDCFVNLNSFLMATYGTIYFNLKEAALLDYMLKSEIIKYNKSDLEIGKTGAKIFYDLYYHLMLLPVVSIRFYLQNNFPTNFKIFEGGKRPIMFTDIDYFNNTINEDAFLPYKNAYLNY